MGKEAPSQCNSYESAEVFTPFFVMPYGERKHPLSTQSKDTGHFVLPHYSLTGKGTPFSTRELELGRLTLSLDSLMVKGNTRLARQRSSRADATCFPVNSGFPESQ
jgi:hypothetical protein